MNSRDVAGSQISLGTCARRARAHPLARSGSAFVGQRASDRIVSPASTETEPRQAGGYGARAANRPDQVASAGNSTVRIQPDATTPERTPDSRAHRPYRQRRRSRVRTQGNPPAGKFCRQQSHNLHLSDGGREVRERDERVAGKFPCRTGSVRGESAAARLRNLSAVAADSGGQVSKRSSCAGAG